MIDSQDIGIYVFCPRLLYLKKFLKIPEPETEIVLMRRARTSLSRKISMSHTRIFDLTVIQGMCPKQAAPELFPEIIGMPQKLKDWFAHCVFCLSDTFKAMKDQMGSESAFRLIDPIVKSGHFESKKIGVKAFADRVNMTKKPSPVLIRSSDFKSPRLNDILQSIAVWICFSESERDSYNPFIERCGHFLTYQILPEKNLLDRLYAALDGIKSVYGGYIPPVCEHGNPKKCNGCSFEEPCYRI